MLSVSTCLNADNWEACGDTKDLWRECGEQVQRWQWRILTQNFWVIFLTWPQIPYDPSADVILVLASVAWLQMWNMNRFRNPKLFESWLNSIWNFLTLIPPRYAGVTLPNPHHLLFRAAFHLIFLIGHILWLFSKILGYVSECPFTKTNFS